MRELREAAIKNADQIVQAKAAFEANSSARGAVGKHISELNEQIRNIQGFIKDIEAISMQVKILSLNASVEAARAGVHGKGFAVVAHEIAKLSESTNDAVRRIEQSAKEMASSVSNAVKSMDGAKTLGAQFDKELEECIENAHALSAMMTE